MREFIRIIESQQMSDLSELEALVAEVDAIVERAQIVGEQKIAALIDGLASAHPDFHFQYWNSHGMDCVDVVPALYAGAPKSFDKMEAEDGLRAAHDPAVVSVLTTIANILAISNFVQENFHAELNPVPPL